MYIGQDLTLDLVSQINKRCSWRKYKTEQEKDIELEKMNEITTYIEKINKLQDIIKISYIADGTKMLKPLFVKLIKNAKKILVFEVVQDVRPLADVLIGMLGELVVLYLTKLGLGTVWMGGDGFCYSSEDIQKHFKTSNEFPICIPFGYAEDSTYVMRKRKTIDQLTEKWPESEMQLFELLNRAPTAMNQQKFVFSYEKDKVTVKPLRQDVGNCKFYWLDAGIAAAHAAAWFGNVSFDITDGIVINKQQKAQSKIEVPKNIIKIEKTGVEVRKVIKCCFNTILIGGIFTVGLVMYKIVK